MNSCQECGFENQASAIYCEKCYARILPLEIKIDLSNPNIVTYKQALEWAWADGVKSVNEHEMLEQLRNSLQISLEQHFLIENSIISQQPSEPAEQPLEQGIEDSIVLKSKIQGKPTSICDSVIHRSTIIHDGDVIYGDLKVEKVDLDEGQVENYLELANRAVEGENFEEALEYFNKVLENDPEDQNGLIGKALALGRLERYKQSINIFEKCLDLGYDLKHIKKCITNIIGFLENKISENQTHHQRHLTEAQRLQKRGKEAEPPIFRSPIYQEMRKAEANQYYKEAKTAYKHAAHYNAAHRYYLSIYNYYFNFLVKCCDKSLELDPTMNEIWQTKIGALTKIGNRTGAMLSTVEFCDHLLKRNPRNFDAWKTKIYNLHQLGEVDTLLDCFLEVQSPGSEIQDP